MTFEEILPGLKSKKKYVRTGWGGAENYVQLFDTIEQNGVALEVTPYFLINVTGEGEGDKSLAYWRQVHEEFFTEWMSEAGLTFTPDSKVVLEEFRKVYPL